MVFLYTEEGLYIFLVTYESKNNLVMTSYARPSVHTLHVSGCQMSGYFGGKAYGHLLLVKQRQLKSQ